MTSFVSMPDGHTAIRNQLSEKHSSYRYCDDALCISNPNISTAEYYGRVIQIPSHRRSARCCSALSVLSVSAAHAKDVELLNVSYDPTRELYEEYNKAFAAYWLKKTGDKVTIKQIARWLGQTGALRGRRPAG